MNIYQTLALTVLVSILVLMQVRVARGEG